MIMNKKKYAPIIIPTLCRYVSFVRLIESLKSNKLAEYTDIYIGLDYPKNKSHFDGYNKIKEYLAQDFPEFNSFNVRYRKRNVGGRINLKLLVNECEKEYDRWIQLSDDLDVSDNFIQFMDCLLDKYEDRKDVVAITGYSYPIEWIARKGCNYVLQNFVASDWGIGFWKNKYEEIDDYLKQYGLQKSLPSAYNNGFNNMTNWCIKDFIGMVNGVVPFKSYWLGVYDISLRAYIAVENKSIAMPLISKVRNYGYDGSGIDCSKVIYNENEKISSVNYDYSKQVIDKNRDFIPKIDENFDMPKNRDLLNEFDIVDCNLLEKKYKLVEAYVNKTKKMPLYRYYVNAKNIIIKIWKLIS